MPRGTLSFDMDKSEIEQLAGFVNTINVETKTDRFLGPVLTHVHSIMSEEFNDHMDRMARAATAGGTNDMDTPFHHVYEWDMIGVPQGRLWSNRLEGQGYNRWATFNWRASKRTVPVPPDELGPNAGERSFKRIHVFVWKAMVMEFQTSVEVRPKRGRWLGWESDSEDAVDGLEFSKGPIYINPGGQQVKGAFTGAYGAWWGGDGAETLFNTTIRKELEEDFARGINRHFPKGGKMARKSLTIRSMGRKGDGMSGPAFARGEEAARRFLRDNKRNHIEAAKRREEFAERFGGGGEDY